MVVDRANTTAIHNDNIFDTLSSRAARMVKGMQIRGARIFSQSFAYRNVNTHENAQGFDWMRLSSLIIVSHYVQMESNSYDSALRLHLHHLPANFAWIRRAKQRTWLEAAWYNQRDSTLNLRYCCIWSPYLASVCVDCQTGIVYTADESSLSIAQALEELTLSFTTQSSLPLLPAVIASVSKTIDRLAADIWPERLVSVETCQRTPIEQCIREAVRALSRFPPVSQPVPRDHAASLVLDGVAMTISLLTGALHSVRRPVICKPVPHWVMHGYGGEGTLTGSAAFGSDEVSSPHAQNVDFDANKLAEALSGLPTDLHSLLSPEGDVDSAALAMLPAPSLLLLYWLLCCAPMHLVRYQHAQVGADASFHVVYGCWSPVSSHEPPTDAPLWSVSQAFKHGTYPRTAWFHGTANDNAYSILAYGLRNMSATRHASSGSIYGDGVYATNDIKVSHQFTKRMGRAWAGVAPVLRTAENTGVRSPLAATPSSAATYAISAPYRTVLELSIIASPGNKIMVNGRDVTTEVPPFAGKDVHMPDSCYVVVPDDCHLRITKLHVYTDGQSGQGRLDTSDTPLSADSAGTGIPAARQASTVHGTLTGDRRTGNSMTMALTGILLAVVVALVMQYGHLLAA